MALSHDDLFEQLAWHVPDSLISEYGWTRLARRVQHLVGWQAVAEAGLEIRLSEPEPIADFFLPCWPGHPATKALMQYGQGVATGSPPAALARLLSQMSDEAGRRYFTGAMLEFDIAEVAADAAPQPGLWARLHPKRSTHPNSATILGDLCRAVGWDCDDLRAPVERVFRAITERGRIIQIGVLPERLPRAAKVNIGGVAREAVASVLDQAGWPGDLCEISDTLDAFEDVMIDFRIGLDLRAANPTPMLGLELYVEAGSSRLDTWLTSTVGNWRAMVSRLLELGWCRQDKADGLLAYPGLSRLIDPTGVYMLYRGINHVKLTLGGSQRQAKAYAGYRFYPEG